MTRHSLRFQSHGNANWGAGCPMLWLCRSEGLQVDWSSGVCGKRRSHFRNKSHTISKASFMKPPCIWISSSVFEEKFCHGRRSVPITSNRTGPGKHSRPREVRSSGRHGSCRRCPATSSFCSQHHPRGLIWMPSVPPSAQGEAHWPRRG